MLSNMWLVKRKEKKGEGFWAGVHKQLLFIRAGQLQEIYENMGHVVVVVVDIFIFFDVIV